MGVSLEVHDDFPLSPFGEMSWVVSLTVVVQMRPKLHVSVSSGSDVEITLDLVPLQTAKHATGISLGVPRQLWRLRKLPLPLGST